MVGLGFLQRNKNGAAAAAEVPGDTAAAVEDATATNDCLAANEPPEDEGTIVVPEPEPDLEHDWTKGDHLIRWEMLPIAYPIQIHAIVLEANTEFVKLVDFGLTAVPNEVHHDLEKEKDDTEKKKKFDVLHKYLVKPLQPGPKKTKKERLIIRVLTTQKDIKPWKKVNYNGGFLGMGGKKGTTTGDPTGDEGDDEGNNNTPRKSWYNKMSVGNMFGKRDSASSSTAQDAATTATTAESSVVTKDDDDDEGAAEEASPPPKEEEEEAKPGTNTTQADFYTNRQEMSLQKATADSQKRSSWLQMTRNSLNPKRKSGGGMMGFGSNTPPPPIDTTAGADESRGGETDAQDQAPSDPSASPTTPKRTSPKFMMNPAMANLMKSTKNKASSAFSFASSSSTTPGKAQDGSSLFKKKKGPKLPKDDPAALVLARVGFLLEQGEAVLPPYNVFSSNSETIAVWCKTGHFRTIQADVFLHSTAIGNGKSAGVIAMGVAATSGLAAAGVAGIGVAAVIAPWWYLKHSKDKTRDGTAVLNDAFWSSAHATPEVMVACIEAWGGNSRPTAAEPATGTVPEEEEDEAPPPATDEISAPTGGVVPEEPSARDDDETAAPANTAGGDSI